MENQGTKGFNLFWISKELNNKMGNSPTEIDRFPTYCHWHTGLRDLEKLKHRLPTKSITHRQDAKVSLMPHIVFTVCLVFVARYPLLV